MNAKISDPDRITPREHIDFRLDASIPRYWYENDPYKTRLMDGMQMYFPDGERYFITCVRPYRGMITDPVLAKHVKDFTRQEGQHGIAHTQFNELLRKQGLPVDRMLEFQEARNQRRLSKFSKEYNLALTAAFEHFTALLAEGFFTRKEVMAGADKRVKALFAWHAIEEMEHKAVVFNVMTTVAKVGYFKRCAAMLHATWDMTHETYRTTDALLKADGFSWLQRKRMYIAHLPWMYGRKGVYSTFTGKIIQYLKPGFHPDDIPVVHNYPQWVEAYARNGDPGEACEAMVAAAY
ncbi:metal-dependent hydrolase [Pseudomonas sp. QL9]|uniref:metal-dependent hydrolase n=1 Tax=Pseudomonas sp. QL9 TaxID=3242725 RepID=UPI00352B2ED0